MSYRIKKLRVGKGKTEADEKNSEWIKRYFELEIDIPDEHELSEAKENVEALLNDWLGITQQPAQPQKPSFNWDPTAITWQQAEGAKGPFERSEDVNNIDFKNMAKDLTQHNGKLTRKGIFYWLFPSGSTVGRK